jgi:hypothetical protein
LARGLQYVLAWDVDDEKEEVMANKSKAVKHTKGSKHLHKGKQEEAVKPLTTLQLSAPVHINTQITTGAGTTTGSSGTVTTGWDLVQNKTSA